MYVGYILCVHAYWNCVSWSILEFAFVCLISNQGQMMFCNFSGCIVFHVRVFCNHGQMEFSVK